MTVGARGARRVAMVAVRSFGALILAVVAQSAFKFKLFSIEIRIRFRQNSNYLLDVNHFNIFKRGKNIFGNQIEVSVSCQLGF